MRLKVLVGCFWLLSSSVAGFAQDSKLINDKIMMAARFGGLWVLDASKSDLGVGAQSGRIAETIAITSTYFDFLLIRKITLNGREHKISSFYYTDGRGETNRVVGQSRAAEVITSKTKWQGSKLVSKTSVNDAVLVGDRITFDIEEVWELSDDGNSLIDTFTLSSPIGIQRLRYVYNRPR